VALPEPVKAVTVDGQFAYVLMSGSGPMSRLAIVDTSQPNVPVIITLTAIKANKFVVAGRYLYALSNDLHIYDLSDLAAPVQIGYSPFGGSALVLSGRYLYIGFTESNAAGLRIIDLANPAAPVLIGEYAMPVTASFLASIGSDIIIDRHYAYVALACCVSPLGQSAHPRLS
jgi:hypothetical protein